MDGVWIAAALAASLAAGAGCAGSAPRPADATAPEWGDANADGVVDINDGVRIVRHALAQGPPPACRGQGDLMGTGDVAFEAAQTVWDHLFVGNVASLPSWDGCETPVSVPPAPDSARVELWVEAEDRVSGSFDAEVRLRFDGPERGPDAWSFGVAAEGCRIVEATRAGTVAASTFAEPPGLVAEGFALAEAGADGAVTAVVVNWLERVHVDASAREGSPVLALRIEASPPASGCSDCMLSVRDGLTGGARPVAAVVGMEGWSWVPKLGATTVEVCGD